MNRLTRILASYSCCFFLTAMAPTQTYKTIAEYKLAGSSANGLALDSDGRRLFVAGSEGVLVLNADSGTTIGTVGGLKNAHDVVLVPEMKGEEKLASTKGFASDTAGHVIAFSLADLKPLSTIQMEGRGPTSLCYDVDTRTIEAVGAAGSLATIDADTNKVVKAGSLVTGSGQIACGSLGHVFVADPSANVVHGLNYQTMKNDGDYPLKTGNKPSGLALDTKGRRLFVTCEDGTIEVIDTDAGFTFIELNGGRGAAHETFVWLPQGKGQWKAAAFVAQADGTLSGIRMNAYINYSLGGQYKLNPGLGAIAYDEKTHHLFITSTDAGAPVVRVVAY